jgi:hypothetical protein
VLRDFHLLDLFTERGTVSVGKRSLASAAVGASFRVCCFERFWLGILDWMGELGRPVVGKRFRMVVDWENLWVVWRAELIT